MVRLGVVIGFPELHPVLIDVVNGGPVGALGIATVPSSTERPGAVGMLKLGLGATAYRSELDESALRVEAHEDLAMRPFVGLVVGVRGVSKEYPVEQTAGNQYRKRLQDAFSSFHELPLVSCRTETLYPRVVGIARTQQ